MCVPREGERECSCVSVRERESSIDCVWRHLVTSMEDERNQDERERGGRRRVGRYFSLVSASWLSSHAIRFRKKNQLVPVERSAKDVVVINVEVVVVVTLLTIGNGLTSFGEVIERDYIVPL